MTSALDHALSRLSTIAAGLDADDDGVCRLMERVAQQDDAAEALRAALALEGARVVLKGAAQTRAESNRRAIAKHRERVG